MKPTKKKKTTTNKKKIRAPVLGAGSGNGVIMENLFDILYIVTKYMEDTNEMPLFCTGFIANTANFKDFEKVLDVESKTDAAYIFDNADLLEFLNKSGIDSAALYNDLINFNNELKPELLNTY